MKFEDIKSSSTNLECWSLINFMNCPLSYAILHPIKKNCWNKCMYSTSTINDDFALFKCMVGIIVIRPSRSLMIFPLREHVVENYIRTNEIDDEHKSIIN